MPAATAMRLQLLLSRLLPLLLPPLLLTLALTLQLPPLLLALALLPRIIFRLRHLLRGVLHLVDGAARDFFRFVNQLFARFADVLAFESR